MDGETRRWFGRRSVENVVAEINEIGDRYPLGKVLFVDDSFVQGHAWLRAFLDGYRQRVHLPWLCSLRVNRLNEGLAENMVTAGLEMVNYAMESADPDVQQRLLNRGHIRNGEVIRAISLLDRFDVRARMQNMIGLPLSNPLEDALNTLQFNMRHRVTDSWCSIFQPYPRTALGQYCVDHGFANPDQLENCAESFFDESRLDIPNKDELYALQKLWYFIVDGNLPIDLVQILIRGRFTPPVGDQLQRLRFRCSRKRLYGLDDDDPGAAVNAQSREQRACVPHRDDRRTGEAPPLIRAALKNTRLPDQVVDILLQVEYGPRQIEHLQRYLNGERVYDTPIYTIDDRTGELKNPDISIYIRGTNHPESNDIRLMPEERFMGGMAEVRNAVSAREEDEQACESELRPVTVGLPDQAVAVGSP